MTGTPGTTRSTRPTAAVVARVLLAALFVGAGLLKLAGAASMVDLFAAIGVGQWLRYVVAIGELLGAGLLLTPRFAGVGAVLLSGIMLGAVATQLALGTPVHLFTIGSVVVTASPVVPAVVLAVLVWIAWTYRRWTYRSETAQSPSREPYPLVRRR